MCKRIILALFLSCLATAGIAQTTTDDAADADTDPKPCPAGYYSCGQDICCPQ